VELPHEKERQWSLEQVFVALAKSYPVVRDFSPGVQTLVGSGWLLGLELEKE